MAEAEDPRRLVAEFELVQREMGRVERRLEALEEAVMEANQAAATLRALAGAKKPAEALVPVGAGIHVRARLDSSAPVVRPVGAGTSVDGPLADAQAQLEARVEALTRSFQEASEHAQRLAQAAAELQGRLASHPEADMV
ncbi:MAG TPA: prefoldin subunit alpha [Candidatus Thermoplasmatota archaeon]|nr:prefoldin subunit alpha [Candidatus Thermoplasmatota archaeon]